MIMKKYMVKQIMAALVLTSAFMPVALAADVVKDAYKRVVNVITYGPEGNILHNGVGAFIDAGGTCAAAYSLFVGASSADVIDFKGNKLAVHRILGANSSYDLVRFSTTGAKKVEAATLTDTPYFAEGTSLYLCHYTTNKKELPQTVCITNVQAYNDYKYLKTTAANSSSNFGCPLLDEEGNLVAFVQENVEKGDSSSCAIDARFLKNLSITTMSGMNSDLRAINIPKALPATEKDALTYIYMMSTADSVMALTALNDFIAAYPDNAEGYTNRGKFYAAHADYARCEADFATALTKADGDKSTVKSDEVHNELSKLMFQKAVYAPAANYDSWTLKRATEEAATAYGINPQGVYLLQQGRCLYADKQYSAAYDKFMDLTKPTDDGSWTGQALAEAYFYAARSLEQAGGDSLKVISLLDSAIVKLPTPYTAAAAIYFFERAIRLHRVGEMRKAVMDYNEYEKIVGTKNLTAQFYFTREQAELACRMYQQAVDDIHTAIARAPEDLGLKIEEAVILLRAGEYAQTISVCQTLVSQYPDLADCYKLMGLAYGETKQKQQALKALNKAKELGDTTVDEYIKKYQ